MSTVLAQFTRVQQSFYQQWKPLSDVGRPTYSSNGYCLTNKSFWEMRFRINTFLVHLDYCHGKANTVELGSN